ncbi:MAG TPA: DUF5320 domain-containing protein [Pontiellaceae bacterium]|nr:DUF5320 domain-containing protein [Pontiellaceae bacterium]HPR82583.1 DUF5320 domain-containing protein [Pontiellaceae bacterium]
MPRGDRTGPAGAGPMSGRGAGFCAGTNTAGFQTAGGGFGRGCGRGFGFRNRFAQPVQTLQGDELLELKEQMARIEQRLGEIQKKS